MSVQRYAFAACFCLALAFSATAAKAQSADTSFAGKTVTLVIGLSAGGNYDFYARFFAEYFSRHIPGRPSVIVQNRGGAGSRSAANYVYTVAPKDGTVMAMTLDTLPLYQALGGSGVRFDLAKVNWVGNIAELNSTLVLWHTAPAKTMDAIKKTEVVLGSTGKSSGTYMIPAMMNGALGTKFKIIIGFPGTNEINLATERGEVHGRAGGSWDNFRVQKADWVREKKIIPIAQVGVRRDPVLPDVPLVTEFAETPEQKKLLELVSSASVFSRAFYLPPGVSSERVEIMRRAFDATVKDPALLKMAKDRDIEIRPQTGEELQKLIVETLNVSPPIAAKARELLEMNEGG